MKQQFTIDQLFKLSWAELTTKEHALVLIYLDSMKNHRAKDPASKMSGHYMILIMKALRKNKTAVSKINEAQLVDCFNDINFFHQPWYDFPVVYLEDEKGEWYIKGKKPEQLLKHHTFGMLCRMDSLFSKWAITEYNDAKAFPPIGPNGPIARQFQNDLFGIIYCDPEQFDEKKIEARGKAMDAILTDELRVVIMATYVNIKKFIIDGCPTLFPKKEEDEEGRQPETGKPPTDSEPMWDEILMALSETPQYQGMKTAKEANMYEALNILEKKAIQALNQKENAKG